jgi:hypothetical protein
MVSSCRPTVTNGSGVTEHRWHPYTTVEAIGRNEPGSAPAFANQAWPTVVTGEGCLDPKLAK